MASDRNWSSLAVPVMSLNFISTISRMPWKKRVGAGLWPEGLVPGSLTFSQLGGLPAWRRDVHLTGSWTVVKYWLAIMWSQIWIKKTFIGDSMPSKSRVQRFWWALFPFWERESSNFLIKALLIRKSSGPSVRKSEASDLTGAC